MHSASEYVQGVETLVRGGGDGGGFLKVYISLKV